MLENIYYYELIKKQNKEEIVSNIYIKSRIAKQVYNINKEKYIKIKVRRKMK